MFAFKRRSPRFPLTHHTSAHNENHKTAQVHIQKLGKKKRGARKKNKNNPPPTPMGADVTGTNKRQIASAHGQAEGALQSRGRSLLLALLHRRKHGGGSEEAAGLNKSTLALLSPRWLLFLSASAKIQRVTFEPKPLNQRVVVVSLFFFVTCSRSTVCHLAAEAWNNTGRDLWGGIFANWGKDDRLDRCAPPANARKVLRPWRLCI